MYRNKERAFGTICIMLGVFLLLGAVALIICNFFEDNQVPKNSDEILYRLPVANIKESKFAEETIPLYITNPDIEMPTVEIDGFLYIGRIDIPGLEISLPVMSEWSYAGLKKAPCRYFGSAYQNDMVIIAHNYKSHFGDIKKLDCEEVVVFTDIDGNVFQYKVAEVEQLQPSDTDNITVKNRALTLITCTIDGEHSIAVRCTSE